LKKRILFLDIETAPSLGWVWAKYDTTVVDFKANWYMLSFAYKWIGESGIHVKGLIDYPGYSKDFENDKKLCQDLWNLLDEAEIVIGHNADKFDIRKTNTRFITHGMKPPSLYKTVDTLKIARKVFKFDSNKLDDLGNYLGIGRKLPHTGFHLWKSCMVGDESAWRIMKKYNKQDVALLEKVYFLMRPWATTHPNVNHGEPGEPCPKCGSKEVQRRGFSYTQQGRQRQRLQCLSCFGWYQGPAIVQNKKEAS
jgi:uncharacterized protein YprB with RNaseH-like and TPR domain